MRRHRGPQLPSQVALSHTSLRRLVGDVINQDGSPDGWYKFQHQALTITILVHRRSSMPLSHSFFPASEPPPRLFTPPPGLSRSLLALLHLCLIIVDRVSHDVEIVPIPTSKSTRRCVWLVAATLDARKDDRFL